MTQVKILALVLLISVFHGCSGTSDDTDYSTLTDAEMLALADRYMETGHYEQALENYKRVLLDFPTSNLHIKAQLRIAETYGAMDKWEDQFNQLDRLVKENIIPAEVPQLYLQIGRFYERAALFNPGLITSDTTDYNLAVNYYDQALKYPDSDDNEAKAEAVYRRALVEAKTGKIDAATARYKMVNSLFPNSDFSILAQMKLKDPNNVKELMVTDSALTSYKKALGLIERDAVEEEITVEEQTDSELESTIEMIDQESQQTDDQGESYQEEELPEPDTEAGDTDNPDSSESE